MDDIRRLALTDEAYYVPLVARAEHLGLIVRDGLVYSPSGLLYIPKDETVRTTLMREVHDAPTGGHLGREKTYARLTAQVYWQGVYHDVRDYVRSCVSCAQNKASNRTASDFLHPLPIPARRWETISMDFVGPLPKTSKGHDFLLVVVDKFSKMAHFIPCTQTVTASEVAQLMYDGVVRLHGFPECILSDRDTRFTSHFWRALWKLSGTQLAMSTSYHPQTDGQTENVNRVVQDILRAYVSDSRKDWDRYLTAAEIAINSSRHASTGYTPFFLNHNQEVRLPFGIALKEGMAKATVPAAAKVMGEMQAHDETARGRMAQAQVQQEKAANRHRREEVYEVGEQVMLSTKHLMGYKHKLACRFIGPFPIVEVGPATVRLELPRDMKVHDRVNVDKVKRYSASVGEWPGRTQESRPLPTHVSDDGQGEYEVEAILGKREELEEPPTIADDDATFIKVNRRGKAKKVMVTRYLVQWTGYSMDECSWERAANLAGAQDVVVDYERRLAAEDSGRPSVMALCVGGTGGAQA
jgi:transposase InsO family protein